MEELEGPEMGFQLNQGDDRGMAERGVRVFSERAQGLGGDGVAGEEGEDVGSDGRVGFCGEVAEGFVGEGRPGT
jgi:hypothetical protein